MGVSCWQCLMCVIEYRHTERKKKQMTQQELTLVAIAEEILDSIEREGKAYGFTVEEILAKVSELA